MRAQLAAVEPRQRSTRSSAAQAKKALTRQAAVSYAPLLLIGQPMTFTACRLGWGLSHSMLRITNSCCPDNTHVAMQEGNLQRALTESPGSLDVA